MNELNEELFTPCKRAVLFSFQPIFYIECTEFRKAFKDHGHLFDMLRFRHLAKSGTRPPPKYDMPYKSSRENILGASEITANLYCNYVYLYW